MRIKRSERLIEMTVEFLARPHEVFPLDDFTERFGAAKSSVSEDLAIVKEVFERNHFGEVRTFSGARGGVQYLPYASKKQIETSLSELGRLLSESERLLPGGYVYTSDILSSPHWLKKIGRLIASQYVDAEVDAILTIATKGIPIAQAVANDLNVPFLIVRKSSKVTEGSTVGINYLPYSSAESVERMELSTRSLNRQSNVLIIDDFLRGGGTLNGLQMMAEEFECHVVDSVVFIEHTGTLESVSLAPDSYKSLLKIDRVDPETKQLEVSPGTLVQSFESF